MRFLRLSGHFTKERTFEGGEVGSMRTYNENQTVMQQLVEGLLDAWNAHDTGRIESFYAAEYEGVDVGQAEPERGPQGISRSVDRYLRAFPDLSFVEEGLVVEGDRAVLVWTAHGTHGGKLMSIPPTWRKVSVRGVSVLTVENEKITRGLYVWDVAGLLRTIGLLPEL
ncbi:MAG TPA: ester cyclase [Rubrobacter sp.]